MGGGEALQAALAASLVAGLGATALGAAPVFLVRSLSARATNLLLAFAAGVMLAAAVFSLVPPALALAREQIADERLATLGVVLAIGAGALLVALTHPLVPHEHLVKGREGPSGAGLGRLGLLVTGLTIHNFPEGLSVGVGAASGDFELSAQVATAIAIQNVPEGLVVAVAMRAEGAGAARAFAVAAATGLTEILGALVGGVALSLSAGMLPWALAAAGGAMLYVVSDEVIPETHRPGFEEGATASLFAGFGALLLLNAAFGGT